MDDPDITLEEYVRLETERALRNGKVYIWETATYGKIWNDEDVHYLRFFKEEFLAIVYNDALASKSDFSYEPTDNDDDNVDIKQYLGDLSIEPLPNLISIDVGTYAQGLNAAYPETWIQRIDFM
ncbi:hypothetical protein Tco_1288795 [Tanacetum coccineum]